MASDWVLPMDNFVVQISAQKNKRKGGKWLSKPVVRCPVVST
jgi:hypothetical protein